MASSRKLAKLVPGAVGGLVVALIFYCVLGRSRYPIDGIWRSDYYNSCMCDSYNFFVFRDGRIIRYSDQHLTDYAAGSYEELGRGYYRVTLNHHTMRLSRWTVHPGKETWLPPPDKMREFLYRTAREFRRLPDRGREHEIIASATPRDERIKASIAQEAANKARMPAAH